jgi:phosphopantothenate synthetase
MKCVLFVLWVPLVGLLLLVGLAVGVAAPVSTVSVTLVAIALAIAYFVQKQKLAEAALSKDLFTSFNQRYDALSDRLREVAAKDALGPGDQALVLDYFNLCAEETTSTSRGTSTCSATIRTVHRRQLKLCTPSKRSAW